MKEWQVVLLGSLIALGTVAGLFGLCFLIPEGVGRDSMMRLVSGFSFPIGLGAYALTKWIQYRKSCDD